MSAAISIIYQISLRLNLAFSTFKCLMKNDPFVLWLVISILLSPPVSEKFISAPVSTSFPVFVHSNAILGFISCEAFLFCVTQLAVCTQYSDLLLFGISYPVCQK